ncbi:hypothetical protein BpHYR1_028783 [Brachionus plicatilis]|uniref:Uncharacterized protein n=1 Tax=Brachionus plicatilis TaxID=10195 RepID=A0A3M7RSY9_BRAPC|nr:hypothetical protein BpHYR1_028783 [Brachionus plicatilis]
MEKIDLLKNEEFLILFCFRKYKIYFFCYKEEIVLKNLSTTSKYQGIIMRAFSIKREQFYCQLPEKLKED